MGNQYEGAQAPTNVMPGIKMTVRETDFVDYLKGLHYKADAGDQLYLQVPVRGRLKWMPITSKVVYAVLSNVLTENFGKYISAPKVKEYLDTASVTVIPQGPPLEHFNRIGSSDGAIVLDLHDGADNAAFISYMGWEVRSNQEVLFADDPKQLPLPAPVPGNGLDEFFDLFNVKDLHQKALLGAWLVASFFTEHPRAHLALVGEKGCGKTNLALALKNLIDPRKYGSVMHRNFMDMAQVLDHQAVPLLDNVGKFGADLSNLLCSASTGGTVTTRVKFTTDDDHHFDLKKGVILTSIGMGTIAADLMDRLILIERSKQGLCVISEGQLTPLYEEMRPRLMGTILTAVSQVVGRLPGFHPTGLVRMADYHRIGLLASEALGYGSQVFDEAIRRNTSQKFEYRRRSSPVVNALVKLMEGQASVQTYMSELIPQLQAVADDPTDIPGQANQLSRVLTSSEALLQEHGISIRSYPNDSNGKPYVITNEKAYEKEIAEYVDEATGAVYALE